MLTLGTVRTAKGADAPTALFSAAGPEQSVIERRPRGAPHGE